MKKALAVLSMVVALAFAGLGFASKYGFYAGYGYDGVFGGQFYLGDNTRVSVGVTPFLGLAFGGSLDFILGSVDLAEEQEQQLQAYYGAGIGGGFITVLGAGAVYFHGHGLGGVEFGIPDTDLSVFGELGLGPILIFASGGSAFTFGYDFKLGLLFR